jgi:hypothetical protein
MYSLVGDKIKYKPKAMIEAMQVANSKYTKMLAVNRIRNTKMIARIIAKGIDIKMITQVLDKEANRCEAASAPKAEYIYCYIFCSFGMHKDPLTYIKK